MIRISALESYHPIVLFVFFASCILFTMFFMHPVYLAISLISSTLLLGKLVGLRKLFKTLLYILPIFILIAISNPIFSHKGVTPLFYINYNPITLESILYGIAMATMIMSIMLWFRCYNLVMTSDKFICLFGNIIPTLALIISITLRLIPKLKDQIKQISNSQRTLGMYIDTGSILERIRSGIRILSILITWALENGIDTADSMKARGYGLKGRTTFSIFKFDKRDGIILGIILLLVSINILGEVYGYSSFYYYPYVKNMDFSVMTITFNLSYFLLLIFPTIIEIKEDLKWRSLISKI